MVRRGVLGECSSLRSVGRVRWSSLHCLVPYLILILTFLLTFPHGGCLGCDENEHVFRVERCCDFLHLNACVWCDAMCMCVRVRLYVCVCGECGCEIVCGISEYLCVRY